MKISIERLLLFVIAVGVSVIAVELLPTYRKDRIYNLCIEHEKLENHLRSSFYNIRNHDPNLHEKAYQLSLNSLIGGSETIFYNKENS